MFANCWNRRPTPEGVVNVVTGFGPEAGEPLSKHPDIRKLAFTGSTEIGSKVMQSAAESITDVTLELGGQSPLVRAPIQHKVQAGPTTDYVIRRIWYALM